MGVEFGRKRYKSRREKRLTHARNMKVIFIFAAIALAVLLYKNRWPIRDWLDLYVF